MHLEGSCHCGAVRFELDSPHPYPYMRCYCSICRKTQGGGGYVINISGDALSLKVVGEENITIYKAKMESGEERPGERKFCRICGSGLWAWDSRWPELLHPFASAIDTVLPPGSASRARNGGNGSSRTRCRRRACRSARYRYPARR